MDSAARPTRCRRPSSGACQPIAAPYMGGLTLSPSESEALGAVNVKSGCDGPSMTTAQGTENSPYAVHPDTISWLGIAIPSTSAPLKFVGREQGASGLNSLRVADALGPGAWGVRSRCYPPCIKEAACLRKESIPSGRGCAAGCCLPLLPSVDLCCSQEGQVSTG